MNGPYADLMWSDPDEIDLWANNMRGAGWLFGKKVTKHFNQINGLELICRAHQLVNDGYLYWFDEALVTVWSAPNYCYRMRNDACILMVDANLEREFRKFKEVPESANS